MRRLCSFLVLLLLPLAATAAGRNTGRAGDLYLLSIAVDQFPNKGDKETLDSYNWCAEEMAKIFREGGKPLLRRVETQLIVGREVTHPRALAGLAWLRKNATRKDLAVVSIDAHGEFNQQEGWYIQTVDKQYLTGLEIKTVLRQLPCQVLVVIETCTSGGFTRSHRKDVPLPPNVTALCACRAQQHTDNHLSISVSEALWGKADFNKDGVVDLDELVRYAQLRHKELVLKPKAGAEGEEPIFVKAPTAPAGLALTTVSPDLVAVACRNEWYQALRLKDEGGKYRVHLLGWDSKPGPYFLTDTVDRQHICLPEDPPPVKVEKEGKTRLALLVSKEGANCTVRYLGKQNKEEVVPRDHVRLLFGAEAGSGSGRGKP